MNNFVEEVNTNEGLLNWSIDRNRTNNVESSSPTSVSSYVIFNSVGQISALEWDILRHEEHHSINRQLDICIIMEEKDEEETLDLECPICFELTKTVNRVRLGCGHTFCGSCIIKTLTSYVVPCCALCRTHISCLTVKNVDTHDLVAPHCNNIV